LAERKFPSVIIRPKTNLFSLDFHAEQTPNRDSRVGLGTGTDRFGNRMVHVDWRYSRQDVDTVARSFDLLRADLAEQGVGRLTMAPDDVDIEAVIRRDGAYGGHHIGTARMGSSPSCGVVNGDGKVFGVNNLYVAGSAVFPTSGQANPTLTIVALAMRLASHLMGIATHVPRVSTTKQPVVVR
jgi:choline dehydrogenase-like flavoprotein